MNSNLQETDSFDTLVHVRDPKTGILVKENHYALHCVGQTHVFERGGKYFWPNGEHATEKELKEKIPSFNFKPAAPDVIEYRKAKKALTPGAKPT